MATFDHTNFVEARVRRRQLGERKQIRAAKIGARTEDNVRVNGAFAEIGTCFSAGALKNVSKIKSKWEKVNGRWFFCCRDLMT